MSASAAVGVVVAVARRPHLWGTAVRQGLRLATPGWWRRNPRLPTPPKDYLHFRLVTNYGGEGMVPEPGGAAGLDPAADLVAYLEWCRRWPAVAGERRDR